MMTCQNIPNPPKENLKAIHNNKEYFLFHLMVLSAKFTK